MKLCVIGGAGARSAFLTKSLVKSARGIRVDHIVLLDNNEEHLRTYGQISKELARRMEPSLTFDITSDARGALTGADYIITTIRAGGDAGRLFGARRAGAGDHRCRRFCHGYPFRADPGVLLHAGTGSFQSRPPHF